MVVPELDVDLDMPPERRWEQLADHRRAARELLSFYVQDIGGLASFAPLLRDYVATCVDPEYVEEMRGVARVLGAPEEEVQLANLYYDAMKLVLSGGMGCTAFALDTERGPIHARNLDWTTADGRLASATVVVNFRRRGGAPLFRTVGWPGFVGCLSGVAPGRFAVTLNAVISEDPPELATPITFLLRRVLESAPSYAAALSMLQDTSVASDSLLLVSGVSAGEMAVVERAPKRAAIRLPTDGAVFVTNDYRALAASPASTAVTSALATTSCSRYARATDIVAHARPEDANACLAVLADPQVKMGITVQHLVLSACSGDVVVALPQALSAP